MAGSDPRVKVASDGAGGKHGRDRRIARVGWGAVAVLFANDHPDCSEVLDWAGVCGGIWAEQTVPRAEVAGLTNVLELLPSQGLIDIGIDNSGVVAQFNAGERAYETTAGDLWALAKGHLAKREGCTRALKIKSHAEEKDFDAGLTLSWAIANEIADIMAGQAADRLEISADLVTSTQRADGWAASSLLRGITVIKRCIGLQEKADGPGRRKLLSKPSSNAMAERKLELTLAWSGTRHLCDRGRTATGRAKRGGIQCKRCRKAPEGGTAAALLDYLHSGCTATGDVEETDGSNRVDHSAAGSSGDVRNITFELKLAIAKRRLAAVVTKDAKRVRLVGMSGTLDDDDAELVQEELGRQSIAVARQEVHEAQVQLGLEEARTAQAAQSAALFEHV